MAPRGKGIPFHIRKKIAEHFEENGFDKRSRRSAEEIYDELSKSVKPIPR